MLGRRDGAALEPLYPLGDIRDPVDLAVLTVVHDVNADLSLPANDIPDTGCNGALEVLLVDRVPERAPDHHLDDFRRADEAADVRGQDAFDTRFHGNSCGSDQSESQESIEPERCIHDLNSRWNASQNSRRWVMKRSTVASSGARPGGRDSDPRRARDPLKQHSTGRSSPGAVSRHAGAGARALERLGWLSFGR